MVGGPGSNCDNQDCMNPNCACNPCLCSEDKPCGYPERNCCGDTMVPSIPTKSSSEMG